MPLTPNISGAVHTTPIARITAFLKTAGVQFQRHDSDIARQITQALARPQAGSLALPPADQSPCDVLPRMLSGVEEPLLKQFAACVHDLHWRPAGFGKLPDAMNQKLAVVELIGPTGMLKARDIRIGVLLQREAFRYPEHRHAAEELYLVLKGTADWAVDTARPAPRAPGSFVHHHSLQPHSMTTRTDPLLALWGWTGDIAGSSYAL